MNCVKVGARKREEDFKTLVWIDLSLNWLDNFFFDMF